DAAVAARTPNPGGDVRPVIEEGVVGQHVHADPRDRLVGLVTSANHTEARTVGLDLRVAVHAGLRGWDRGDGRSLYRAVAVAAVHPHVTSMEGVAEGHGLLGPIACIRVHRRPPVPDRENEEGPNQRRQSTYGEGDFVCPARKDGRHDSSPFTSG